MNIKYSPLYAESWNVAFRMKSEGSILSDKKTEFHIIPNSSKYWAADPMVFEFNGNIFIFAELYDYKLCRGTIGYTLFNGSCFSAWKQVIVEEYHMSYPYVFCLDNEIYMLPETSEAEQLILYKAVDFPEKWEKVRIISDDVKWVDTTLLLRENGIIGFTKQLSEPRVDYMLTFDNEFNLLNKVTLSKESDKMRCGGRCFRYNDEMIRVCQDCHEKYGGALIFRFCNINSFAERANLTIRPDELCFNKRILLDGMHTYTALNSIEVIDIKTRRFNIRNFIRRVLNKMK